MDALREAIDRIREWHDTLAPWVRCVEAGVGGLVWAAECWLILCLIA